MSPQNDTGTEPEVKTKNYYYDKKKKEVWCFTSKTAKCFVMPGLASLSHAIPAHDEDLMQCTKEINALLHKVIKANKRDDVELHLLDTPRGFLLAWVNCHGVSGDDRDEKINKAFGLQ